jgi:hypothetical protein
MLQAERIHSDGRGIDNVNGNIINRIEKMDKTLKLGHAIFAFIGLIITVGTMIVNQSNKIETQRLRIEFLESGQRDMMLQYREINSKLTDILVKLENKENKK